MVERAGVLLPTRMSIHRLVPFGHQKDILENRTSDQQLHSFLRAVPLVKHVMLWNVDVVTWMCTGDWHESFSKRGFRAIEPIQALQRSMSVDAEVGALAPSCRTKGHVQCRSWLSSPHALIRA